MFCDLLGGLPGALAGGGLNNLSSILASFTYWHDFPNSTMLLSIFRDINLKPERNKQPLRWNSSQSLRTPFPTTANEKARGQVRSVGPGGQGGQGPESGMGKFPLGLLYHKGKMPDRFLSSHYKKKLYHLEVLPGTKLFNIYFSTVINKCI